MLDHLVCNLAVLFYFIEVPVPNQGSERSCICVLGVSILHLSTILTFNFEIIPSVVFFKNVITL